MPPLTKAQIDALLAGPINARLATVKPDGAPYVVPVWQYWDGKSLYIIPREKSRFVAHIRHEARVAVSCADDVDLAHPRRAARGQHRSRGRAGQDGGANVGDRHRNGPTLRRRGGACLPARHARQAPLPAEADTEQGDHLERFLASPLRLISRVLSGHVRRFGLLVAQNGMGLVGFLKRRPLPRR